MGIIRGLRDFFRKVESAVETTVLAKKEGARKGYLNRCVFLGDSRSVAMVNYLGYVVRLAKRLYNEYGEFMKNMGDG